MSNLSSAYATPISIRPISIRWQCCWWGAVITVAAASILLLPLSSTVSALLILLTTLLILRDAWTYHKELACIDRIGLQGDGNVLVYPAGSARGISRGISMNCKVTLIGPLTIVQFVERRFRRDRGIVCLACDLSGSDRKRLALLAANSHFRPVEPC